MTTTETPSVDEARIAYLHVHDWDCSDPDSHYRESLERPCPCEVAAFERLCAAVRAEAIRERDEAVGLLREAERDFAYLVQMVMANDPKRIDNGTRQRQNGIMAEAVAVGAQGAGKLRAFLSRFPEAPEGGEG